MLFLSAATIWAGWVFFRHHRQVRSIGAASLAATLILWGVHHLDYPFLRARGVWNPWGYYLDILFVLAMGAGFFLLVLEEQHRGIGTLSALSADLQSVGSGSAHDMLARLLQRPLALAGVSGSAMYTLENGEGRFVGGAGVCADWPSSRPGGGAERAIVGALDWVIVLHRFPTETLPAMGRPTGWASRGCAPPRGDVPLGTSGTGSRQGP